MKGVKLSRSRKMWLVMVVAACLVIAQYEIASSWLINSPGPISMEQHSLTSLQAVVDRLQLDNNLVSAVGERVLREIALQVSYYNADI